MNKGQIIGKNVARLREAQNPPLSQAALARGLKVALYTIQAIEKGATQKSKYLPDIARFLGVPLSEIDPDQADLSQPVVKYPLTQLREPAPGVADLPLHAMVEAGTGALVMSSDPVDRIARPQSLQHVKDAYAVIVVGDSMLPVLRPGYRVQINPHLPPKPEDLCVFIAEEHGDFRATIKEFVAQTKDIWRVKRYHPKTEFINLKKKEWARCEVVVGILLR